MVIQPSLIDRFLAVIEAKKPSDKILLRVLFFATIASGIYFIISLSNSYAVITPTRGGVLSEGIVGIPRFVNPALALTRADQDTTALIYSGLLKISPDGLLIPDIAESVSVSEDGLTYTIELKRDRSFHDGKPITTRDVLYTINLIRDPDLKSPLRGNWADVELEEIDEYSFRIILREAYTPFIENFTFGIMPHHIWNGLPVEQLPFSQYNTEPIGSGPFMISQVIRDNTGLISGYELEPAKAGANRPNLAKVELHYFQNETLLTEALQKGEINATVYLPSGAIESLPEDTYNIINQPLPRIFGLFFNQNRSASLRDAAARQALSAAIDREELIKLVLGGYGVPTDKPIVSSHRGLLLNDTRPEGNATTTKTPTEILESGGWRLSERGLWEKRIDGATETLSVTIRTGNSPLFDATANFVAESWRSLGAEVQIEQYEQTGLVQSVIRSRDFQALLFGLDMNRQQDLYPFWHSSQKDDPGLNIAQYTNITVDGLLEQARTTQDLEEQTNLLEQVSDIIAAETPAIFLYAPTVVYVIDKDIGTATMQRLGRSTDRFMNIETWHAQTDVVWPIFTDKNNSTDRN